MNWASYSVRLLRKKVVIEIAFEQIFGGFLVAEGLASIVFSQDKGALSQLGRVIRMVGGAFLLAGGE